MESPSKQSSNVSETPKKQNSPQLACLAVGKLIQALQDLHCRPPSELNEQEATKDEQYYELMEAIRHASAIRNILLRIGVYEEAKANQKT